MHHNDIRQVYEFLLVVATAAASGVSFTHVEES